MLASLVTLMVCLVYKMTTPALGVCAKRNTVKSHADIMSVAEQARDTDEWWGIGGVRFSLLDEVRTTGAWVDSSSALYTSTESVPPADVLEYCTPKTQALSPGCLRDGTDRVCEGGTPCSRRVVKYKLEEAGNYFVGVFARSVTSLLRFSVGVGVGVDEVWGGARVGREGSHDIFGRRGKALVETYARVSVAHGVGVSIGLVGVPATFFIRSKDKYGNLQNSGGDLFEIDFAGPCGTDQTAEEYVNCTDIIDPQPVRSVIDLGGGEYFAMYTLTRGGKYDMRVTLHNIHIR